MAKRKKAAPLSIRDLDAKAGPHKGEGGGDATRRINLTISDPLVWPQSTAQRVACLLQAMRERHVAAAPAAAGKKRGKRGPKKSGMAPKTRQQYEKWEQMRDSGMTLVAIAYQAGVVHSAVSNGLRKLQEIRQAELLKLRK